MKRFLIVLVVLLVVVACAPAVSEPRCVEVNSEELSSLRGPAVLATFRANSEGKLYWYLTIELTTQDDVVEFRDHIWFQDEYSVWFGYYWTGAEYSRLLEAEKEYVQALWGKYPRSQPWTPLKASGEEKALRYYGCPE